MAVMLLARKWRWIDRVSPMAVLYVIGLLVANLTSWIGEGNLLALNNTIGNVCIPLAIPLMLISCSLSHWSTGKALKAFLSGLLSVLIVILAGFFLFRGQYDTHQFAQVSAVAVGIYTGGIPNMGAIAQGVGMDQETYLYVTSYDLIVTGLYLVFVICFGKPVFRKLLPAPTSIQAETQKAPSPLPSEKQSGRLGELGIPLALTLLIAAISYFISTLLPDNLSTPILILILTTLSIGASFLPFVRKINRRAEQENRAHSCSHRLRGSLRSGDTQANPSQTPASSSPWRRAPVQIIHNTTGDIRIKASCPVQEQARSRRRRHGPWTSPG